MHNLIIIKFEIQKFYGLLYIIWGVGGLPVEADRPGVLPVGERGSPVPPTVG